MKVDDNGVYIELISGEERLVPWEPYDKVLEGIKQTRANMKEIPKVLRFFVKRAMKEMTDEEFTTNALAKTITTVEELGGTIDWRKHVNNG